MFRGSRRRSGRLMDVYLRPERGPGARAGWVVAKFGHRIVERNRLKRRIREILRRQVLTRPDYGERGVRILVRTRRNAYRATYPELERELLRLVVRA